MHRVLDEETSDRDSRMAFILNCDHCRRRQAIIHGHERHNERGLNDSYTTPIESPRRRSVFPSRARSGA